MTKTQAVFARQWSERHCDRVWVDATGERYDKTVRRASLRAHIRVIRNARAWAA